MSPQVKGQTLKSLLLFMQQRLSPAQLDQALSSIAPEARAQIDRGILATSTFPMVLINQLTAEGARVSSVPVEQFARDAGRFLANEAVRGVYRLFARALTPEAILSKAASMWSAMNTAGRMEVTHQGERSAAVRLVDYPSERVMCARINGWIEGMADLTGARQRVVTKVRCVTAGGAHCEWRIRW